MHAASYAWLALNKAVSFEGEHHLMDCRCGDIEVPLQVGLGGRASEYARIRVNERQILPLCRSETGLGDRGVFVNDLIRLRIHLRL